MIECPAPLRAIWKKRTDYDNQWLLDCGWTEDELEEEWFFDYGDNYELMKLVNEWNEYLGSIWHLNRSGENWRQYVKHDRWPKNRQHWRGWVNDFVIPFEERWG